MAIAIKPLTLGVAEENQHNCRNCGAPHNGKCSYCGTYYGPMAPKMQSKPASTNWDSLTPMQKTALAILLVVAPYHLYRKHIK